MENLPADIIIGVVILSVVIIATYFLYYKDKKKYLRESQDKLNSFKEFVYKETRNRL